jgi:hypothetical protein
MASDKPKTRQMTLDGRDISKDSFPAEKVGGGQVTYKSRTNHGYYYGYKGAKDKDRRIYLGPNDETIVGTYYRTVSEDEARAYLSWVEQNCTWHRTVLNFDRLSQVVVSGTDHTMPAPEPAEVTIESTVHRKMTPALTADLANAIEAKAARVAKKKAAAKAAKAKRDKERREAAKAEKSQASAAEFGDLAAALKTLKKHGLRIVTVEEKAK